MTFTNENPNRIIENKNEKFFSLKDIPKDVIEKVNAKLEKLTKNENSKLETYGRYGNLVKMTSVASLYSKNFGPSIA
ncbi:hypothetical protein SDC9_07895 [bioreactor metagenome]|uniref:Uncharacterized protein n=1 Tax=bioreactor metagenome TaxID=1076179 RepID=A0A644T642_9ZZZZ|nr:hypothetical protein [Candidatus Elulimicrobiales bacterium]MEA4967959.1 hypothetical protein [Bacteroidaceae bacterium]